MNPEIVKLKNQVRIGGVVAYDTGVLFLVFGLFSALFPLVDPRLPINIGILSAAPMLLLGFVSLLLGSKIKKFQNLSTRTHVRVLFLSYCLFLAYHIFNNGVRVSVPLVLFGVAAAALVRANLALEQLLKSFSV